MHGLSVESPDTPMTACDTGKGIKFGVLLIEGGAALCRRGANLEKVAGSVKPLPLDGAALVGDEVRLSGAGHAAHARATARLLLQAIAQVGGDGVQVGRLAHSHWTDGHDARKLVPPQLTDQLDSGLDNNSDEQAGE